MGLHFLNRNSIDHRDIKPANILLFGNDRIKIADFGLAKQINKNDNKPQKNKNIGTIAFMAPEVKKGNPIPFKSDIYSLGLVLYFMLTKDLPQYNEQLKIPTKYSQEILDLCTYLLREDPNKRPTIRQIFSIDIIIIAI